MELEELSDTFRHVHSQKPRKRTKLEDNGPLLANFIVKCEHSVLIELREATISWSPSNVYLINKGNMAKELRSFKASYSLEE